MRASTSSATASGQHFVHGFLERVEGIDFANKVEMGIRADRYKAMVPQVVGPGAPQGARAPNRSAGRPRAYPQEAQVYAARPHDDLRYHRRPALWRQSEDGDGVRRPPEPGSACAGEGRRRCRAVRRAGLQRIWTRYKTGASRRWSALQPGLSAPQPCTDARLRHQGQHRLEGDVGLRVAAVRARIFPAVPGGIRQVSLECRNSKVPLELISLLEGKDVLVGAIDVASDAVETPEQVAEVAAAAMKHIPAARIQLCTNCGCGRRCAATSPTPSWRRWRRARPLPANATRDRGRPGPPLATEIFKSKCQLRLQIPTVGGQSHSEGKTRRMYRRPAPLCHLQAHNVVTPGTREVRAAFRATHRSRLQCNAFASVPHIPSSSSPVHCRRRRCRRDELIAPATNDHQ